MLEKMNSYKEVAIFYILLALVLFFVAHHNQTIDMTNRQEVSYFEQY